MKNSDSTNTQRGRPPIGGARMVTIGVRVEPAERDRLQALAAERGLSLCAYLREVLREELARSDPDGARPRLSACN